MDQHYLNALFAPKSILVLASKEVDGKRPAPGQALVAALRAGSYNGEVVYADDEATVLGELSHSRFDLALIALPSEEVEDGLRLAGRLECRTAIILGSGIHGEAASQLVATARRLGIRLLGPNSLGMQRPGIGLNASIAGGLAQRGSLAVISQSGAITAAVLDWAVRNGIGFSGVASVGRDSALDLSDMLDFFGNDPATQSIVVYFEGISNARRFMSALRLAAIAKPVVVLKAGHVRFGQASQGGVAARTHSGAMVGSDEVFDAALRRSGAVRVRSFVQLFSAVKCLASRYRPAGKRLAIITNGGGPGVLAADWINELGLHLGLIGAELFEPLKSRLPPQASISDIIDLSEDAGGEAYRIALEAAAQERDIDGVVVIHTPKAGVDPTEVARAVVDANRKLGKPLIATWMGDDSVGEARVLLSGASIANFRTPEAAVDAFHNIASYYENQQLLMQTPPPLSDLGEPDVEGARLLIDSVLAERRKTLTEMESKALLSAFHIPVTRTMLATTPNQAILIATQLGYPVALKIDSPDVLHKSDVQGVALNIANAVQVRDTYVRMMETVRKACPGARINGITIQNMSGKERGRELFIGLVSDAPFGPVITFGAGGTMVELIRDRVTELPPLNQFLAQRLINRARVAETLGEWRGAPAVAIDSIERVLLRVSEMVCELPQLREMDINPLIVDEHGAVAVDARIALEPAGHSTQAYQHLAILPYPANCEQLWMLPGGAECLLRPIKPDDAEMLQRFVRELSSESRYMRFASAMRELSARMLARFTLIDYDREMALAAVAVEKHVDEHGETVEEERVIGISRYITNPDSTSCEFSLVVADDYARMGLGRRLMHAIMDIARQRGLTEIDGLVLAVNDKMLKLMRDLGFEVKSYVDDPEFMLVSRSL
ncbi:bifunctional acetate--CoA ligase family protein/GNAT family N-acetyltransferase [Derxia lacustris]|uniref:bifunctional acetate--CoA ligase family protein/GNAT family N-acetyltransferase n=1 Tax=Derxia lacustris TaxID=764842 RepID=UPI000A16FFB0|nr:bifunctional acetate--CoA ligase family protein/GNAT family N-acetyltransferase [Derxia lacustris]